MMESLSCAGYDILGSFLGAVSCIDREDLSEHALATVGVLLVFLPTLSV